MTDKPEHFREVEPLKLAGEFCKVLDNPPNTVSIGVHTVLLSGAREIRDWLNRALPPEPKPKRAYYETHEPPHCPTCDCGKLVKEDET